MQAVVALLIHLNHSTYSITICRHQQKYLPKQVNEREGEREREDKEGGGNLEIIFN